MHVAGTRYRIADGYLTIKSVFWVVKRIPVDAITGVRRLPAGPFFATADFALGTAVLEIDESGWKTLVSPHREAEFLAELGFAEVSDRRSPPSALS